MNKKTMSGICGLLLFIFLSVPLVSHAEDAASTTLATTSVRVRIETPDATLFNDVITVTECPVVPRSATTSLSAYCALNQTQLPVQWSYFGNQAFLDSFGGVANNTGGNGVYWLWLPNYEYTNDAMNEHLITNGQTIFAEYNTPPLKVTLSATSTAAEGTTTISVSSFGFDASWNPAWLPAASSTLYINNEALSLATSSIDFATSSAGTYILIATAPGFASSSPVSFVVTAAATEGGDTTQGAGGGNSGGGGSGGTDNNNSQTPTFNIPNAAHFLANTQAADGSFGSDLYTDWSAIAFGSYSGETAAKQKITNYLTHLSGFSGSVTDAERRTLALLALGINPETGTSINYIKKITDAFDGTQIGDASIYNDDIFALFPLLSMGYTSSDTIVSNSVQFILSKQSSNGSWIGPDVTAAAIQALSRVQNISGVPAALERAKTYLKSIQSNGGFGSSFSTSWVLQAIAALGETPTMWTQGPNDPLQSLASVQASDGGMETGASTDNRVWATAYALPAVQGKTWFSFLSTFSHTIIPQSNPSTTSNTSSTRTATTTIATSTTPMVLGTSTVNSANRNNVIPTLPKIKPLIIEQSTTTTPQVITASSSTTTPADTTSNSEIAAVAAASHSTKNIAVFAMLSVAFIALGFGIYRYS